MNINILTQYYPPEIGAPQARLGELASFLNRRGDSVTILTAMPNYPRGVIQEGYGGLLNREIREGVRVIRTFIYPTKRADYLHRLANYFSFVLSSAAIGTFALDHADYLITESPPLFLGLSGMWLSRIKRTRLIFNVSDLWPDTAIHLGLLRRGSVAHRMSERLERLTYRRAWLVTGQSEGILEGVRERVPSCRTYHLSNGVDTRLFRPMPGDPIEEMSAGRSCVALYAGLHGLAQGLDQLLEAAALLRGEKLRLVLVGDGPEKASLVARAAEMRLNNVEFLEPLAKDRMPELLASADMVIVPLKTEIPGAVPSKLYEAMAAGRPLVLAASGEPAQIVLKHRAGLVVDPGDGAGIAAAVQRLAREPLLRQHLGHNGRRAAQTHYDRSAICERFVAFLAEHRVTPLQSAAGALSAPSTR